MEIQVKIESEQVKCSVKQRRFKAGAEISPTVNIEVITEEDRVVVSVTQETCE